MHSLYNSIGSRIGNVKRISPGLVAGLYLLVQVIAIHPFFLVRGKTRFITRVLESHAMSKGCKKQSRFTLRISSTLFWLVLSACASTTVPDAAIAEPESGLNDNSALATSTSVSQKIQETNTDSDLEPTLEGTLAEGGINPLTGQVVLVADRLGRRPILAKVTLFPRNNRPQWGLSRADIIYEHYTEGGLSRFSALFYGQEAEIVGPIRSARLVDIQLVRMYGALFAYGSADYRVLNEIDNTEFAERAVREFPAGCPPLCRTDPAGQNHLVTDTQALRTFYIERGTDISAPNLGGMRFGNMPTNESGPGINLRVSYSVDDFHEWVYAEENGFYRRYQESGDGPGKVLPLTDRLTGQPIESANVVLIQVPHELYARTPEIVDIQLYGQGEGMALRDGNAYKVQWIRPYPEGVLYLTLLDGSDYPFKPGTTWFEIVGTTSKVEQQSRGNWTVSFAMP